MPTAQKRLPSDAPSAASRLRYLVTWLALRALALSLAVSSPTAHATGSSVTFSYGGRLLQSNGRPVEGPVSLSVSFYQVASGGSPTLTVTNGLGAVPVREGVFQFSIALSGQELQTAFPSVTQAVYIEITDLTNRPNAPYDRQLVTLVPYAAKVPVDGSTLEFNSYGELTLKSSASSGQTAISSINAAGSGTIAAARLPALGGDLAGSIDAATVGKLQGRPVATTAPNNDEFLRWNGTSWVPSALAGTSGGTVTSVTTGQGLAGGPITASGTIDLRLNASGGLSKTLGAGTNELGIAAGGVTPAMLSVTGCNTDGKILKVSSGAWTCGDDLGLASGSIVNGDIAAGAAIVDSKLAQITTANKVADSALSATVTKLGSDIDLSSAEVTNTLPVSKGGTGATTLTGIAVGNGTAAMTAVAGTASQYLRRNASNNGYEFVSLGDAAAKNTGTAAGQVAAGDHTHANAVAGGAAGFMTGADKTKLDGIAAGAGVVDATSVAAAGAAMDADFGSQGIMLRGASAGSYSILTDNSSNWNTAYTDRLKWDGVAVGGGTAPELTAARTALGLGSMATQAANSVNITGGTISGATISLTGIANSADATAITINSSEQVGIGTGTPAARLHVATEDAATNTATDILILNHSSSAAPAASFGSALLFSGESTTTDGQDMARIQAIWSTATDASRASKLQFQTLTGAGPLTTQMTIDGSGNVGIGTASPTAKLHIVGTAGVDGIKFPDGTTQTTAAVATPACTSGFTAIEFNGMRMGCMQTTEANSGTGLAWTAANDYCWDNFGGRLASTSEWHLTMANHAMTDETDDWEWASDFGGDSGLDRHTAIGNGSITATSFATDSSTLAFRCWIPGNGAGGGSGPWTDTGTNIYRSTGSVGIGTTSPEATLHVNGTAKLASYASAPFVCDTAAEGGVIARTSGYTLCMCNDALNSWVLVSDGATTCTW